MALTRIIVFSGFLTAFAAGLLLGFILQPAPSVAANQPDGRPDRESWLAKQLALSPEQQQQMKQIWSEVGRRERGPNGKRAQFRRERDEAIKALIKPEDLPAYEKIHAEYEAKADAEEAEMKQNFERAVERTKALLTPEQRQKYEVIMSRQGWDRDRGRPSSRPAKP